MISPSPNFYRDWRRKHGGTASLQEDARGHPPERLLQVVWSRQRLRRHDLRTQGGERVTVLHPGFWNREPGPDFRHAVIQFDEEPPVSGDVEIDLRSDGWHTHGHDRNPAFSGVVLHVVWDPGKPARTLIPTLSISNRLDVPLGELTELLEGEIPPPLTQGQEGRCKAPLQSLEPESLRVLLNEAAGIRFESRARQLRARAQEAGWQQTLVEALLRGLGYKHNAWPMQRLAELAPLMREILADQGHESSPLHWQALLLGTGGLLPADLKPVATAGHLYVRQLWNIWWRERDRLAPFVLPAKLWRMAGIRPANHPQRRLALASHWLADETFPRCVEAWFQEATGKFGADSGPSRSTCVEHLLRVLDPGNDPAWSRRWTLRSRPMPKPQPLIGATRVTDLAINVILPWFFVRAGSGKDRKLARAAEALWCQWPPAEDNAVLRLARSRLFGNARKPDIKTAANQQGLLQIVRDFCDHSNAVCENCRFPDIITQWSSREPRLEK